MNKVFKQTQRHEFLTYSTYKFWKRNPSLPEFTEFSDFICNMRSRAKE